MRLLHTKSLTFKEFNGKSTPKYAILSHRWADDADDEITFKEMQYLDAEKIKNLKPSRARKFQKLKDFCWKARDREWDWCWIDTWRIDKSSSAELSESINSMYEWYSQSEECYVYLNDVTWLRGGVGGQSSKDNHDRRVARSRTVDNKKQVAVRPWQSDSSEESMKEFERSCWFTRGWTLQELLAADVVRFYDRHWEFIGTKSQLAPDISRITNIANRFLRDYAGPVARTASIATKMSWAASRETTRVEDAAYSLLGLFDINMPLIYGEGDKAFRRLQIEILKVHHDESVFAWSQKGRSHTFTVLAAGPEPFKGSGRILSDDLAAAWRKPLSVSSKGIEIAVPTKYFEKSCIPRRDVYLIPLACADMKHPEDAISISIISKLGHDAPIFNRYYIDDEEQARWSRDLKPCKLVDLVHELKGPLRNIYLTC